MRIVKNFAYFAIVDFLSNVSEKKSQNVPA